MSTDGLGALVLAGGRSSRMGSDKADLVVGEVGETLLARTVRVTLEVAAECVVVLAPEQLAPTFDARVRVVRDPSPHEGPIVAIAHAVDAVTTPWVFLLATDHPRLCSVVLARLRALARDGDGAVFDGQPFVGVYRTDALRIAVKRMVRDGEHRARSLIDRVGVRVVTAADALSDPSVLLADPTLASLLDADEPSDLEAIERG